jgi:hypothetical protein
VLCTYCCSAYGCQVIVLHPDYTSQEAAEASKAATAMALSVEGR